MNIKLRRDGLLLQTGWYNGRQLLVRTAILGVILVLAVRAAEYLGYATHAVGYPFGLDLVEGIVWQQVLLIPGSRMYGDITQFPYIVFHYPPLYHLVVRSITALGIDPLAAGRGVTLAATIATAGVAGLIASSATRETASAAARMAGAAVAGLSLFTYRPLQVWATVMRVDMLATCFSIAGVYLAIVAGRKTIISCFAIMLFVLAIYTKQTELSAPIAAILVMLIVDVRSTLTASTLGFLVGGAALVVLQVSTDGGFWHHIFIYNLHNPFSFDQLLDNMWSVKGNGLGVLLGVVSLAFLWLSELTVLPTLKPTSWIEAIRGSIRLRALAILSLWFLLASLELVSAGKIGSSINYFIEWMCITTMPIGMVISLAWDRAAIQDNIVRFAGWSGLLLSLMLAVHTLRRPIVEQVMVRDSNEIALRTHLVNLIRENPKPSLSTDMVLLMRAGQSVPIEPGMFRLLTMSGDWDQAPFLALIQDRAFGLIITEKGYEEQLFTSEVIRAVKSNYPLIEQLGDYRVHRPSRF